MSFTGFSYSNSIGVVFGSEISQEGTSKGSTGKVNLSPLNVNG